MGRELNASELMAHLPGDSPLGGVPEECLAALAEIGTLRWLEKDEAALCEGEEARSLFVLLTGRVKMARSLPTGRTLVLALFGPGEIFGTAAAFAGQACEASLLALERSLCLEVRRDRLFAFFAASPQHIGDLMPALTSRLVECKNCIVELMSYRVEIRLAQLFLKLAQSVGREEDRRTFIPIPLSRQELADMAGTTIETCIRVMSRWGKEGVVETARDGFWVRDEGALRESAAMSPL